MPILGVGLTPTSENSRTNANLGVGLFRARLIHVPD